MDKRMKTAITVIKTIGRVVVSIGIGAVAINMIKSTTPEDAKAFKKSCIGLGRLCISGLAASAASHTFGETVDVISESVERIIQERNELKQTMVIEVEAK